MICAPPAAATSPAGPTPRDTAYLGSRPRWWQWSSRNPSRRPWGSRAPDRTNAAGPGGGDPDGGGTRDSPSPARRGDPHGPHPKPRQPRCPPIRSLLRAPRPGIGGGSEGAGVQSRVWGTRPKAEGVVRSRITKLGMLTSLPSFLFAFLFLYSRPLFSVPRM